MTAHLPLATSTSALARTAEHGPDVPGHRAAPAGVSTIALHVDGTGCACPDCTLARGYALALGRLGAYLHDEGPSLARIARLLDLPSVQADLAAHYNLHVEPTLEAFALVDATLHLDEILEALAEVPTRAEIQRHLLDAEHRLARDVDAGVRWLGARTEEILLVIRRALA